MRPILVECNHFAEERKDVFGESCVMESFRFHSTLILLFLKECQFLKLILIHIFVIHLTQLFTLFIT